MCISIYCVREELSYNNFVYVCYFSKFVNMKSFKFTETFYITMFNIFNMYLFPLKKQLLRFTDAYKLTSLYNFHILVVKQDILRSIKPGIRKQWLKNTLKCFKKIYPEMQG